jgi:hypothetical protein
MNQLNTQSSMDREPVVADNSNVFMESIVIHGLSVRALNFEVKEIGEVFESSKHHLSWIFTINGTLHKVELYDSLLTNRRRVIVDNVEVIDTGRAGWFDTLFEDSDFNFNFEIDGCEIEITHPPKAVFFYIKLNGIHFNKLLAQDQCRKRDAKHQKAKDNHYTSKAFFQEETAKNVDVKILEAKERSGQKVINIDIDEEVLDRAFGEDDDRKVMGTPFDDDF